MKRVVFGVAAIFAFVIVWYAMSRILSPLNAVNSYELALPSKSELLPSNTLKIGTYNIAHGRGGKYGASNWQKNRTEEQLLQHLDKIAAQISQSKVEVVVLNEVDFSAAWSSHVNEARYIAEKAGFQYVVEQRNMDDSFPFYHFKFGNAILSKYPVKNSELIKLPHASAMENIFVGSHDGVISFLKTPFGEIGLIAIHLEYRSEEIRVQSVKKINELTQQYSFPVFMVGDFNSTPNQFSAAQKTANNENALSLLLEKSGFKTNSAIIDNASFYTFPSEKPNTTIDWIVGRGDLGEIRTQIIKSALSDHFMMTSEISMKKLAE